MHQHHRPISRRPSAALPALLPALALLVAACAGAPKPKQLGDWSAYGPTFTKLDSLQPPRRIQLSLTQPAYVAVLYVVPGRGATLVFPGDSTTSNQFGAGKHDVSLSWPPRLVGDTTGIFAQRPPSSRQRPDTMARTRGGFPNEPRSSSRYPQGTMGLGNEGYLELVATSAPITYGTIRSHIEGVTIPIEDNEALNAIAKLVRSLGAPEAPWAAYAMEVKTR